METSLFGNNSLSNMIAKEITAKIITGELNPGDKLIEKDYAEAFGTSRAPVREAVYLLTTEGLIERIPRKGAVVKEYTNNDIFDLLEIRNMLELMAVERVEIHGLDQQLLNEMQDKINKMKKESMVYSYTKLNHAFHMCIVRMSRSKSIIETYSRLGWPLLRTQNLSFSQKGNIDKSKLEHEQIYNLMVNQKWNELVGLLSKHNDYVITSMRRVLGE